jgi:hypothetical protein
VLTSPRCCHLMQDCSAHGLSAMYNWVVQSINRLLCRILLSFFLAESSGENFPVPLFI